MKKKNLEIIFEKVEISACFFLQSEGVGFFPVLILKILSRLQLSKSQLLSSQGCNSQKISGCNSQG